MHLSTPTAQAAVNVPVKARACPIGLGVKLSVTTAEPATEMSSVAAGAPAKVMTTSPTYLHPSLRRLAEDSRPPTPGGSQPACAGGEETNPIQPITGWPSLAPPILYPLLFRVILRFPLLRSTQQGNGLTTFRKWNSNGGLGRVSSPVVQHLRQRSSEPPDLTTCLLAQAYQHLWLVLSDDV
jgi:hypothetical protein